MRGRLHLQIYLTILAALALVVVLSSAIWIGGGRERSERHLVDVAARLATLTLAPADQSESRQAEAAARLAAALDAELALFAPDGALIFATEKMANRKPPETEGPLWRRRDGGFVGELRLEDGRKIAVAPPRRPSGRPILGLAAFVAVVAVAVGVGAYPLTRRLTRRLEALRDGVERFGAGDLSARVAVAGRDELAVVAGSFNRAAAEIERLTEGRRLLLANASHELRTPLTRVRLGAEMLETRPDAARFQALKQDLMEVEEMLDALLLSSRLDAEPEVDRSQSVDLLAIAAEEASRYDDCEVEGVVAEIPGDGALLRRMIRNLLENAATHGAPPVRVRLGEAQDALRLIVTDGGDGFSSSGDEAFEPFQRGRDRQNAPGYGLGLAIVRQIARAHGGDARIINGEGGGAVEVSLSLRRGAPRST